MLTRTRRVLTSEKAQAKGLAPDRDTLLWLVAGLALVVLPHLTRLPVWYFPMFVVAAAERLSHCFFRRRPMPAWMRVLLTLVAVGAIGFTYGTLLGRQAGVALLCVMIAMKLIETYRRRDVYLLIALAYFVAVTQFLFNQSVYLLVYIFATVMFITGSLVVCELQPSRVRLRRASGSGIRGVIRNVGLLLAQALPLMVAMFILFPRLSSPLWGLPEDALDSKTGVSGEMSPGTVLGLFIDDSPAFRVSFEGPVPPPQERYWRGPVLWNFDGTTWTRPILALRTGATIDHGRVDDPVRYRVSMEPTERHWLFALDVPVTVPGKARMSLDHTMYRRRPIIEVTAYDAASDPDYVIDPRLSPLRRQVALALPAGYNPRTLALAEQWRAEAGGEDSAVVQRALRLFSERFIYSYQPPPLGRHTVDDFLFDTREGYCEYFASAFTVLMRAAGIPARVVTGYLGGWYSETGNYLLVRNSDAHAWSEVWLEGRGWVRVDPTASVAPERVRGGALEAVGGRRSAFDYAWLRQLRNQLDAIHNFWNTWVLEFNRARQRALFAPAGLAELEPEHSIALLVLVGGIMVAFIARSLLRRQWIGGLDPASREYAKFCRKLARAGLVRDPAEGPLRFAQRAAPRLPGLGDGINRITRLYVALRYAPKPDEGALTRLRNAVRSFPSRPRTA